MADNHNHHHYHHDRVKVVDYDKEGKELTHVYDLPDEVEEAEKFWDSISDSQFPGSLKRAE